MAKKVVFAQKVNNTVQEYYPKTTADNVIMNSGRTVEETVTGLSTSLSALITRLDNLEAKLDLDTVYMKNASGGYQTDSDGTKLVAVY